MGLAARGPGDFLLAKCSGDSGILPSVEDRDADEGLRSMEPVLSSWLTDPGSSSSSCQAEPFRGTGDRLTVLVFGSSFFVGLGGAGRSRLDVGRDPALADFGLSMLLAVAAVVFFPAEIGLVAGCTGMSYLMGFGTNTGGASLEKVAGSSLTNVATEKDGLLGASGTTYVTLDIPDPGRSSMISPISTSGTSSGDRSISISVKRKGGGEGGAMVFPLALGFVGFGVGGGVASTGDGGMVAICWRSLLRSIVSPSDESPSGGQW